MLVRPVPTYDAFRIGHAVRSTEARTLADLAAWLRKRGGQLIPSTRVDRTVSAGSSITIRSQAWRSPRAVDRIWTITARASSSTVSTEIDVTTSGVTTRYALTTLPIPIVHSERLTAAVSGDGEITATIAAVNGGAAIDEIACFEVDRATSDVVVGSCVPGQPIADFGTLASISGAWVGARDAESRRAGLLCWQRGSPGITVAAGTLFPVGVPVLARLLTRGTTTTPIRWSVYGRSVTAAWTVRLTTSASGVTSDIVVPVAASEAWTSPVTVSIHAEDPLSADGRRDSAWDEAQLTVISPGSGSLILSAVAVREGV